MRRTSTIATIIPAAAGAMGREGARRADAVQSPAPMPLTRTAAARERRSGRRFVLPARFGVAAVGLVSAAIALSLYLRF